MNSILDFPRPKVSNQPRTIQVADLPGLRNPVPERALVDTQIPGYLSNRFAGPFDYPDRALLKLLVVLLPALSHENSL
jgi:hypothetical protein